MYENTKILNDDGGVTLNIRMAGRPMTRKSHASFQASYAGRQPQAKLRRHMTAMTSDAANNREENEMISCAAHTRRGVSSMKKRAKMALVMRQSKYSIVAAMRGSLALVVAIQHALPHQYNGRAAVSMV